MIRIADEVLDELIEYKGNLKHVCLNAEGVLKLAIDLKEARALIEELKRDVSELATGIE